MRQREDVQTLVYSAIDAFNLQVPDDGKLEKSPNTALFGPQGNLDSIGLITLIVLLEQRINEDFGATVTLANERAMSPGSSPFRSVATLVQYVHELLNEAKNG